jgi:hypothetical protein
VAAIIEHGRSLGCGEAWVLTDRGNEAAMGLYARSGGQPSECVMFTFAGVPPP